MGDGAAMNGLVWFVSLDEVEMIEFARGFSDP